MTEEKAPYHAGKPKPDGFLPVKQPGTQRTIARYNPETHTIRVWHGQRETEAPLPKREGK